jgi:membrane associated rhomboid family serine protease
VAGTESDVETVRVPDVPVLLTLLTSMFMHGGLLHLGGNMLFLFIFGNNVEDAMGRLRFVLFYLVAGLAAHLVQFAIDPASDIPNIGASGAIAGVLGGYLLLYPRARVLTAITLVVFFYVIEVPALLVLGLWFVLQVVDGSAALASPQSGGVAYWAHIGGFVAGFLLIRPFTRGGVLRGHAAVATPDGSPGRSCPSGRAVRARSRPVRRRPRIGLERPRRSDRRARRRGRPRRRTGARPDRTRPGRRRGGRPRRT